MCTCPSGSSRQLVQRRGCLALPWRRCHCGLCCGALHCDAQHAAASAQHRLSVSVRVRASRQRRFDAPTHAGATTVLKVSGDTSILDAGLAAGLSLPHDCKMGVCMQCCAKRVSGEVNQSQGSMLSADVAEAGYVLLCCSTPEGDCAIDVIPEDELLELQLHG